MNPKTEKQVRIFMRKNSNKSTGRHTEVKLQKSKVMRALPAGPAVRTLSSHFPGE